MKRLAILTAMLTATAFVTVPAGAQTDETAAIEAETPDNQAAVDRARIDALRTRADNLEADLAEVQAVIAENEARIEDAGTDDLNATEIIRMDLNAAKLDARSKEAEILALRTRADEIAASLPEAQLVQLEPADNVQDETLIADAGEAAPADEDVVTPAPRDMTDFLDFQSSELARILISQELMYDDVAIMGIISGARKFCGLNWEPGFVEFILLANQNGYDLGTIADEHGLYMGGATKNLRASGYQCVEEDLVGLRTINPF